MTANSVPKTVGVLLAAGLSRRFGPENKLTFAWQGQPLMSYAADALVGAGCESLAAVVSDPDVAALLPAGFTAIALPTGLPMASSFVAAVDHAVALGGQRLLICLGDMPGISGARLRELLAMPGSAACTCEGARMPPMVLEAADFTRARASAKGDRGARVFLQSLSPQQLLPLEAFEAVDIDLRPDSN
ncbi:nucleotidyltransferase family protein [Ketogulonicigenium vulgare]|uniref:nucleotidyltransferase family protein n=1 Tax=Ketogulonicigenium vulgare TaxID=92945 RepID=UPI0001E6562C|nr:NTP transferase domain-containing protein [Ketogulonicigenium vulgare]ADO41259.1 putative xanthine dehydrogenase accessory factor [Ketogulonicigenium vulgare Y25]ANW32776.1 hypothetical protein KvSKV_00905 [Ketogulonicigenium vulgare]